MPREPRYVAFRTGTDKPVLGGNDLDVLVQGLTKRGLGGKDYRIKDTTTGQPVGLSQAPSPTSPIIAEEKPVYDTNGRLEFGYMQRQFGGKYVAIIRGLDGREVVAAYDGSFAGLAGKMRGRGHSGKVEIRKIIPNKAG